MSTRKAASFLLRAVRRHSPSDSHDWASAMLREMDAIESDRAAVFWALGSSTAILGHWGRRSWANGVGARFFGILSGVGLAGVLALCAFGLLLLAFHFFPSSVDGRMPWLAWLIVIAIPMMIFSIAAVALWRTRRPLAVGVLLSATALGTHFVIALATHRNYQ